MNELGIEASLAEAIRIGEKTVEARLGKPRFLKMEIGDILSIREDIWIDGKIIGTQKDRMRIKITQILYFETFKEMFQSVNFKSAVPTANNIQEAIDRYAEFYSKEDEKKYGVVTIFFDLL
jgi:ASC-1-like (ASCH) protein